MNGQTIAERIRLMYICPGTAPASAHSLEDWVAALIGWGVTAVQLRMKDATTRELFDVAERIGPVCRERGALFLIDDRLDVALGCRADGVHLGASDLPVGVARRVAPRGFCIGATARTERDALSAQSEGVDYIGCGAAFTSSTKQDTTLIGPEGVARVARATRIPTIAIAGIDETNVVQLLHTGIVGVAVGAALHAPDAARVKKSVAALLAAFA